MIAFLRGKLLEKHPNQVIIVTGGDTGGVGYDVMIPISTFSGLPDRGAEVALRIHTHVREDALALFGFLTAQEKSLFEKLISVSGIGPKLAITVLSGLATADMIDAIRGGRVEQLVRIPGVGKKTAERMILELKDKLEGIGAAVAAPSGVLVKQEQAWTEIEQDVLSALMNLGCKRADAEAAVRNAGAGAASNDFEPLFRKALSMVR